VSLIYLIAEKGNSRKLIYSSLYKTRSALVLIALEARICSIR
jgi:hypothetical protein